METVQGDFCRCEIDKANNTVGLCPQTGLNGLISPEIAFRNIIAFPDLPGGLYAGGAQAPVKRPPVHGHSLFRYGSQYGVDMIHLRLAAADSMVDSNIPSVAYATVYPIAMVFLILFIQVIASAVY